MQRNRLLLLLLSLCAFWISSIQSAPTIKTDNLPHKTTTLLEKFPSTRYFIQAEENGVNHLNRRGLPAVISNWNIWKSYKKASIENKTPAEAIPYGTPEGTENFQVVYNGFPSYSFDVDIDCVSVRKVVQLGKKLGSGTFGNVYQATMNAWDETKNAWERYTAAVKTSNIEPGEMIIGSMLAQTIDSRYVAKVWDYFYVKDDNEAFVIMPMSNRGTLGDHTSMKQASFKEVFQKILLGVQAMHAEGIMHRDIKPGNILLFGKSPKIADFDTLTTQERSTQLGIGTPGFLAPEWLSPEMIEEVLSEHFKATDFTEDERKLLSNVLCEPNKRFNIDQYVEGFNALLTST
ncbi:serine/threonine protein kinase [Penicillium taxi]|uniref:serine/threonine protein kinase n=1 Tax=Penicillium taxi TaxID=168475 RepID=UPI0025455F3D|nr:serine/threonine protein kinase [Penicillium taxi]KAJ5902860.1 serine/threonine protein kinase [Penicillium taxi]